MQKLLIFIVPKTMCLLPLFLLLSCATQRGMEDEPTVIRTFPANSSRLLQVEFLKGKAFNHPSFAVWIEDLEGNFLETLYVTNYVGKGWFRYGELTQGKWKDEPGNARRPATLPYWAHKRNIKAPDGLYVPSPETAVPDAVTSATPLGDFRLETATSLYGNRKFRVLLEINQPWDANKFWINSKYEGNVNYLGSLQPALVYAVIVNPDDKETEYFMNPIGHSHPTGADGKLYTDLTTLTTAKEIAQKIIVRFK
ncbi:hypothetical protein SAMN05444274_106101 [Mariniphaga anaerophila]|uniref:DUF2271 domain-containing protein n=1 Tax=Mariniphaga anaerophila TaxID=1484053 RepID=A0A1M5CFJ0_9BACT|nr:hypothetical protein [Mariniphaga anaerophila]SHF53471.1 hypothetical protein SAMN05444274_106101 [Mariniphaga anaerophila]